jgi:hypothetical protein
MLVPSRARVSVTVAVIAVAILAAFLLFAGMLSQLGADGGPAAARAVLEPPPMKLCEIPPVRCLGDEIYCSELVLFTPAVSAGYEDVPFEGETWSNQYASYIRRDLMMAIQYAAARVACMTSEWKYGNGGPVTLLDMSERDGAIPGTELGAPGHPLGSHTGGRDIDIAYYQVDTPDNHVRPVCPCEENGESVQHCVGEPTLLDAWRTALFIGILFEQPGIRIVGVDGRIGPIIQAHLDRLEEEGILSAETLDHVRLAFETEDGGMGWYHYHHHHFHVSVEANPHAGAAELLDRVWAHP